MNDVSDHEATMWLLYVYVVPKNISRLGPTVLNNFSEPKGVYCFCLFVCFLIYLF